MSLKWQMNSVQDWDAVLIEGAPGASITNKVGYVEYNMPTPSSASGDRVETQSHQLTHGGMAPGTPGDTCYYEWEFYIPSSVVFSAADNDGYNTINQFHGNQNAGYTGGFGIMRTTDQIRVRVEGGLRLDSNNYQDEREIVVGTASRNTWHKIGYHVRWDMRTRAQNPTGFARPYLDGVLSPAVAADPSIATNIPTMGNAPGGTDAVMFRCGWYPQIVPASGLNMRVRNVKVYT
jgi:hypothetical protein